VSAENSEMLGILSKKSVVIGHLERAFGPTTYWADGAAASGPHLNGRPSD